MDYETTYSPDGSTTRAKAPGFSLGQYAMPKVQSADLSGLGRALSQRAGQQNRAAQTQEEMARLQLQALRRDVNGFNRPSMQEQDARTMALRDAELQRQAMQNPAPMRMVTGPGVIPGYVQDVNAMNAYQRRAYLPNSSGVGDPGSPTERVAMTPFEASAQGRALPLALEQDRANELADGLLPRRPVRQSLFNRGGR